jgi:hypothetical protein
MVASVEQLRRGETQLGSSEAMDFAVGATPEQKDGAIPSGSIFSVERAARSRSNLALRPSALSA